MNDRPTNPTPSAPTPDLNSIPELAYLQSHGEDFSDMRAELETMLTRAPEREAPVEPQPIPLSPTDRLPFDADGKIFDTPQTPQPAPLDPGTKPTTQEQALDPYAPEGTQKQEAEDTEPGEVVLDAEGKIRDPKTGRYVPHQAMQAERVKRKELEAELTKIREESARANERLQVLTEIMHGQEQAVKQAQAPAPAAPEPEIDPEVDIFGWAKQQAARAAAAEKKLAEIQDINSRQFGEMQTQQRFRSDVTAFAAKTPGFFDAYNHLVNIRRAELEALDFGDANAINNQIAIEEKILVQNEFKKNGSPGERLFKLAVAKGWKAPEPAPAAAPTPAPAAPAPALAPQQQPASQALQTNAAAAAAVKQIQNGIQASATLSGSGGSPGEGITVQQLADMSDDQFVELATKLGKKKLDHLLGGGR